ncbi:MAG TPA: serine hydrolase domain-containing protein [Pseudacidobacterium sp.]|nr:serine hydrolase domain-containing protein [Pseudacidobacterium sp.]
MLRFSRYILAGFLLASSITAQTKAPINTQGIQSFYEAGLRRNGVVGSSLVLIRNGEVVFHDYYGRQSETQPVDENTTYHWASVTKTFTGIAIMQLRDRSLLSLDDPLIKYIPELAAVHNPYGPVSAITIREAMSHSTGFRDATWPWRTEDWQPFEPTQWSPIVAMLPYTDVKFQPGSRFSYSNLAVVFLGKIIERLSGDQYEVYMDKNIFKPLGMDRTYFDRSPYHLLRYRSHSWDLKDGKLTEDPFDFNTGITRSNGGINSPFPDMIKYIRFLVGDPAHQVEYDAILKRSSLEEMRKPLLPVTPDDDFPSRAGAHDYVAASFFVHQDGGLTLVGHPGWQNGFRSQINVDPVSRSAYIVNYNTDAEDAKQNTRRFNIELRDYLIDHFFRPASR